MTETAEIKTNHQTFRLKKPLPDFIPYACLFDHSTILTKNGELMQTMRISGVSKDSVNVSIDLRGIIRKAILDNINSKNFAIWIHTVRRKTNLDLPSQYQYSFASDTHETWCQKNYWRDKFVNELYLTILYVGEEFSVKGDGPLDMISIKSIQKKHLDKLEKAKIELYKAVDGILKTLDSYGAVRLTNKIDIKGARSELLEFISKIIHLQEKRMDIPIRNLSDYLATGKMAFGDKSFQITEGEGKYFGTIFSIKDYQDFSEVMIDKLLRLPQEFIITQTINFTDSRNAKKEYEYQNYILGVSKDSWLHEKSGMKQLFEADQGREIDYGASQLTIMIVGQDKDQLEVYVQNSIKQIRKLGLVAIREDLNMEICFWSQLPGNFSFLRRKITVHTGKIGGFASLHNSPKGKMESKWGNAVTLFRLRDGTPYFFNFHNNEVGHTYISGPQKSGKSTLANFIICEASKFNPKILFIDEYEHSRILIKSLGGYHQIINYKDENHKFQFNPLSIADTPESRAFLKTWFKYLIFPLIYVPTKKEDKTIDEAVDKIFTLDKSLRRLKYAEQFFSDNEILTRLADWREGGVYARMFDNENDDFALHQRVMGYNIASFMNEEERLIVPFMSYLIHQFTTSLDGGPAMMVVNDAHHLFQSFVFKMGIESWLDYLTSKNAMVIFMKDSHLSSDGSLDLALPHKFATLMFMPDPMASENYSRTLKLSDEEIENIKKLKPMYRHFMIKKDTECFVAELNLDGLDYALSALSGKSQFVNMMEEAILESGDDPKMWLMPYYLKIEKNLEEMNKKVF